MGRERTFICSAVSSSFLFLFPCLFSCIATEMKHKNEERKLGIVGYRTRTRAVRIASYSEWPYISILKNTYAKPSSLRLNVSDGFSFSTNANAPWFPRVTSKHRPRLLCCKNSSA